MGAGFFIGVGILLLLLGMVFLVIGGFFTSSNGKGKAEIKAAGGVFIGPFPIIGAFTDKRIFYILLGVVLLFYLIWLIMVKSM